MEDSSLYILVIGVLLGALCLWGAMRANRRRRLLQDTPTSKTSGVFIGFVELKGTAESEAPLASWLAGTACVLYSWDVSEHWSRTVTEHYTDSEGRSQTRTRHESGWTTVASGGESGAFYLQDEAGVILVRPDRADLETTCVFEMTCGPGDPLYFDKGPAGAIAHSDHRRRFTEHAIPLHAQLYVCGNARLRSDIVAPEIAQHDDAPLFIISVRDEQQICNEYAGWLWVLWLLGLVFMVGAWLIATENRWQYAGDYAWIIQGLPMAGLYVAISGVAWIWMVFDSLVRLRQRVRQGWSLIDVQLKRRHDLIPSLVTIVSAFKSYESDVQAAVTALRAQSNAAANNNDDALHACAPQLMALAENYPELQANENFQKLQQELTDTENRIALARGYYNEIATYYNTRLQTIPEIAVAQITAFRPHTLFTAADFERAPVDVKLSED